MDKLRFHESLKGKMTLAVIFMIVLFIVVQTVVVIFITSNLANSKAAVKGTQLKKLVDEKIKDKADIVGTNAISLSENSRIVEAFEKNDYTIAEAEINKILKKFEDFDFKGTRVHITRANMTTLYRSYNPKRDDDVSFRPLIRKVVAEKKTIKGIEVGKGGVYLRALSPVFQHKTGAFLGILELQVGLGSINKAMLANKTHYILLVDKKAIDEEKYKKAASDVSVGEAYLTANSKWFDPQTVKFAQSLNYEELLRKGFILNDKVFATYKEALDLSGKRYGIEVYGMDREVFDEEFKQMSMIINLFMLSSLVLSIAIILMLFFIIQKVVVKPINMLVDFIGGLGYDLTKRFSYQKKDEIGILGDHINRFLDNFRTLISKGISSAIMDIGSLVSKFSDVINRARQSISEQSDQAQQIATASEQMSQTINDIAKNTSMAAETSVNAMKIAQNGSKITQEAVGTIENVQKVTSRLSSMIDELSDRSAEIGDIVTVIKDIADQTNLLALNAAIEASRAGEQGRGFAVVADEVRKLAEKTIKATVDISDKIKAIQDDSNKTAESMKEASAEVINATSLISEVEKTFNEIFNAVKMVKDEITQVAASVDEQSSTTEEVARNIEKTSVLSKEIDDMASEMKKNFDTLAQAMNRLRESSERFRV